MKSIRRHLVFGLMIGATMLLGSTSVALYLYSRAFLIDEFDAALRSKALALVTLTEENRGEVKLNFADEFMPEFERRERPEYFQVWLDHGATLERSRSLRGVDLPRRAGVVAQPAFWDVTLPDGRAGRAVGIQFAPQRDAANLSADPSKDSRSKPEVALVVARERTELNHTLFVFRIALLLFGLLLLAALAVLVTVVVRRGLDPLGVVGERAAAINASSLGARFPTETMPQELHPICQRLNDLLARLEEAFQRERRISADIAHELGTPLAELRTLAEVAIKWPGGATEATATFRDALAIVEKMETMVAGLLALAQSEEGKLSVRSEPVLVARLVEEIWLPLRNPARGKQLELAMDIPRELQWHSDPELLRHILRNLIHNAVEYCPVGGRVRIAATTRNTQLDFLVENTTDNLTREDLPRLFERFWRKNAARTSSGHSGLGLTFAQSVATVLGLTLTAEMPAPGVLRLLLCGPL